MAPRNSTIVTVNDTSHADVIHPHVGRQRSLVFSDRFFQLPIDVLDFGSFAGRDSNVVNKDDASRPIIIMSGKIATIDTDFPTGIGSQPCAMLKSVNIKGILSKLEKFQCSSALPNIKYNCAVLFWCQLCWIFIYASKYIFSYLHTKI